MPEKIVLAGHYYNPLRESNHSRFKGICTDPQGLDWTGIIAEQSYTPQARKGVFKKTSFDFQGALECALADKYPETVAEIRVNMATRGVADAYIHPLLPD